MTPALTAWWSARDARERRILQAGGAAMAVILIIGLWLPLSRSLSKTEERLNRKQQDLAWIQSVEPRLAVAPRSCPGGNQSLVTLVTQTAQSAGVGAALHDSVPSGAGALRVRFDGVAFDNLAGWLAQLTQNCGVRTVSASIDGVAPAGAVNATLVLNKS